MARARADAWARALGAGAGAALAAVTLAGARVPPGSGELGLDLTAVATPTGEIAVSPPGPALAATGLRPGGAAAAGERRLRNQTGRRRAVRLRALPSSADVDRALRVRVTIGAAVLYDGALGGLRRWTPRRAVLRPAETATLALRAWLPPGATGWRGRVIDVPLELSTGRAR